MILENEPLFTRLLARSPFSARELNILISTAPERYKDHFIEKRNGRGRRLISQPTAELKFIQRLLVHNELSRLPLHNAATAYRPGRSIRDHAAPHAAGRYLLKLDFQDFFPSIKESAIRHRLKLDTSYSEAELWILCQLLCRREHETGMLQLSIGAPSSPFISNYILWELDTRLEELSLSHSAIYTRYADDLAFSTSTPHVLDVIYENLQDILKELDYLGIELNHKKTVNVSRKNRRTLVGLSLTNAGNVSIGREEKRKLRAMMHTLSQGGLQPEFICQLRGRLAFVQAVDPSFVENLCAKYGFSKVSEIEATR